LILQVALDARRVSKFGPIHDIAMESPHERKGTETRFSLLWQRVVLARALAHDLSIDHLRDLWLVAADIFHLLSSGPAMAGNLSIDRRTSALLVMDFQALSLSFPATAYRR
jgi:hypothetical protein